MTAGPDGFRGLGPRQILGILALDFSRLLPVGRHNRLPHHVSFPRKRHMTGELGLCRDCLPIALPLRHHGPNDACHLVGQSNGNHEAGSSGQQALDPRIGPGWLRSILEGKEPHVRRLSSVRVSFPKH
jgi:hypothetical protein